VNRNFSLVYMQIYGFPLMKSIHSTNYHSTAIVLNADHYCLHHSPLTLGQCTYGKRN